MLLAETTTSRSATSVPLGLDASRDERLPSVREHDDVTLLTARRRVLEESESPIGPQTYRNAHPLTKSDAQKGRGKHFPPLPDTARHTPEQFGGLLAGHGDRLDLDLELRQRQG